MVLAKIPKAREECAGSCGARIYTLYCDRCAPPSVAVRFAVEDNDRIERFGSLGQMGKRRNGDQLPLWVNQSARCCPEVAASSVTGETWISRFIRQPISSS